MKEELNKRLLESLDEVGQLLSSGVDFASAQVPQFINEILAFSLAWNLFWVAAFLPIVLIPLLFVYIKQKNIIKMEIQDRPRDGNIWAEREHASNLGISAFISFAAFVFLAFKIKNVLMIYLAPRLYLIEYVRDLMSTCGS